jgi:hypothetical protein
MLGWGGRLLAMTVDWQYVCFGKLQTKWTVKKSINLTIKNLHDKRQITGE